MDGLIQAVLNGNIFIQTQCSKRSSNCALGSGSNQVCSACCRKEFHESELQRNSPGPVCGQRQCWVGRIVRNQRSETPDQSAARSTTLEQCWMTKNEKASPGREAEEKKEGSEVALEIRTCLRPERPGTTPESNVRQRESKERKKRESRKRQNRKRQGNERAKANDTEGKTHPTHKQTREREKGKTAKRWRQSSHSFSEESKVKGLSKTKKGSGHNETIQRRGTDSPGPVCGRKSQVPSEGDKETKTEGNKGRGMLGQSTDTVEVVRSQEITKQ